MANSKYNKRRWSVPSKRAKGYAADRKAKVHTYGPKEGKELTDFEAGIRSGYLQAQSDHAGMYKYTDMGGYAVLDIVFGDADRADLIVEPFEITDDKTKQVIKGNRYLVRTVDEDGKVYECPVKPSRTSDRSMLQMLLVE